MHKKARVAGILSIISGASCLIGVAIAAIYIVLLFFVISAAGKQPLYGNSKFPAEIFIIIIIAIAFFALIWTLIGAFAIIGGIFALKTKRWALALAGSIAGAVIFLPTGIAATILISMARQEFSGMATAEDQQMEAVTDSGKGSGQNKARITGILSIIAGICGILTLGYSFLIIYLNNSALKIQSMPGMYNFSTDMSQITTGIYLVWGIASAIIGILALICGIFTLKRKSWGIAVAGAIADTIVFYPCGIPAIILIALAKDEFSTQSIETTSGPG